jgi:hypothetical protein
LSLSWEDSRVTRTGSYYQPMTVVNQAPASLSPTQMEF